jgi:hypothetical protein
LNGSESASECGPGEPILIVQAAQGTRLAPHQLKGPDTGQIPIHTKSLAVLEPTGDRTTFQSSVDFIFERSWWITMPKARSLTR